MNSLEKTLEYHELLMTFDDTDNFLNYELPEGFHYDFYKNGDEFEWAKIHIESGEFMCMEEALKIFHSFYDYFLDELPERLFFVVDDKSLEKVGTATISKLKEAEFGHEAVVDWVAIKKRYQGRKLSKPMISKFLSIARDLGHKKLLLHTQTHTWLAAKLYLDFGFEPFNVNEDIRGWKILKTITDHDKLINISNIPEEDMYFKTAVLIKMKLNAIFGEEYEYSIWDKNGRNDVWVNRNGTLYKFKYIEQDNDVLLIEEK